jgi:hypothetical protein
MLNRGDKKIAIKFLTQHDGSVSFSEQRGAIRSARINLQSSLHVALSFPEHPTRHSLLRLKL